MADPVREMAAAEVAPDGTAPVALDGRRWPQLFRLYSVADPAEVGRFLTAYPFLATLAQEVYPYLRTHFAQAPAFLEVVADPETNEAPQLVIAIAPTCAPEEAVDQYERLTDEWLVPALPRTQGKLAIILEYR